jgi:hypothetical protein
MTRQGESTFTLVDRARADADDTAKGRWAGPQLPTRHITGTMPDGAPLPCPAWSAAEALLPPEEPLGYSIDELPSMETVSGQPREEPQPQATLAQLRASLAEQKAVLDQLQTQLTNQTEEGNAE